MARDAVVNLVGILHEGGRQTFSAVQAQGPRIVAEAATKAGVGSLVQVSAIGADANSPAEYARSKAAGEAATLAAFPTATIVRPSIVFGPEDQFFNRFAQMARFMPFLPLVGGGETKFQPVYVGDVAEAIARTLDGAAKPGATYELGGPEVKSFKALLEYITRGHGPFAPAGDAALPARAPAGERAGAPALAHADGGSGEHAGDG